MAKSDKGTENQGALVTAEEIGINLPILTEHAEIMEVVRLNMEGVDLTFDRIKMPSGGSTTFEVPDDSGDTIATKELVGVILDHHKANAYWASNQVTGSPPDCSSMDGITGVDSEGNSKPCARCPQNQWGTAVRDDGSKSRGKACKNLHRIYILTEGEVYPYLLTIAPTGLSSFADYVKRLTSKRRKPFYSVITKVRLQKETSRDGHDYAKPVFGVVDELPPDAALGIKEYRESLQEFMRRVELTADDYDDSPGGDAIPDDAAGDEEPF